MYCEICGIVHEGTVSCPILDYNDEYDEFHDWEDKE